MSKSDKKSRRFGGKLGGFTDKVEQAFHQRMLKAYLKGHQYFRFGAKEEKNQFGIIGTVPAYYEVLVERK